MRGVGANASEWVRMKRDGCERVGVVACYRENGGQERDELAQRRAYLSGPSLCRTAETMRDAIPEAIERTASVWCSAVTQLP